MATLSEIALKYNTDKNEIYNGQQGHGYIKYYEKHLPETVNSLLEIGCFKGESLRMWREYYPTADLYTIDLFEEHKEPQDIYGLTCIKGNQTSLSVMAQVPPVDIIIDDGSHNSKDQIDSFNALFNKCKIYVIEDLHCCEEDFYRSGMKFEETILGQIKNNRFKHKHFIYEDKIVFIYAP